MRWYRKAADQGNTDAQNNIGWLEIMVKTRHKTIRS